MWIHDIVSGYEFALNEEFCKHGKNPDNGPLECAGGIPWPTGFLTFAAAYIKAGPKVEGVPAIDCRFGNQEFHGKQCHGWYAYSLSLTSSAGPCPRSDFAVGGLMHDFDISAKRDFAAVGLGLPDILYQVEC
jgi:hypothetical protein